MICRSKQVQGDLVSILHFIHYTASIPFVTRHCFISPQRAKKQEFQWESSIWPVNISSSINASLKWHCTASSLHFRIISGFKRQLQTKHLTTHPCPAFLFKSQLPLILITAQSLPSSAVSLLQLSTHFLSLSHSACPMKISSFLFPVPAVSLSNVQLL